MLSEDFNRGCDLLPEGVSWSDNLTPELALHIADTALRAQADVQPVTKEQIHEAVTEGLHNWEAHGGFLRDFIVDSIATRIFVAERDPCGLPIPDRSRTHPAPEAAQAGLKELPHYSEWLHLKEHGQWSDGVPTWARDHEGHMNDVTAMREVIDELAGHITRARAATVAEPSKDEPCPICGNGTGKAICDGGLLGHCCDSCGSVYGNSDDMRLNKARAIEAEQLGYVLGELPEAAQQHPEPAKCQRCGADTADSCEGAGCGYLTAGNGELIADEIACSSCGLTMEDSKALAAMKQAEPVGEEPELWTLIEQYADAVAEFNVATYRGIDSKPSGDESLRIQKQLQTRLAAQSGQRAGVAEGHTVVPQEPTPAMLDAAERLDWTSADVRGNCCNMWNVMLAAVEVKK